MDAEFLPLAQEAVAALQAANQPSWVEVAQLIVSSVGLSAIFWGLFQMQQAGQRRDREIDVMAENMRGGVQALERQGRALEELLRRTA